MKILKTIGSLLVFAVIASSCNNQGKTGEEISHNSENYSGEIIADQYGNFSNELLFNGELIKIVEEGVDKKYCIQEITKQKQELKYRAKRIPSELFLRNQGLESNELNKALAEVSDEQLFYFEFEQEQKQDLIKKYLENDLDANIAYMSFGIFNDFKLINDSGDTIPSTYSLYERNYHVAPYERLIISFNGVDQNEAVRLIYTDQLFGKGDFDFAFASTNYVENNFKNPS